MMYDRIGSKRNEEAIEASSSYCLLNSFFYFVKYARLVFPKKGESERVFRSFLFLRTASPEPELNPARGYFSQLDATAIVAGLEIASPRAHDGVCVYGKRGICRYGAVLRRGLPLGLPRRRENWIWNHICYLSKVMRWTPL